jgi:hypothetical protein
MKLDKLVVGIFSISLVFIACTKNKTSILSAPLPTINSINPTSGQFGTIDTIVGTHFSISDSVKFNGLGSIIQRVSDDTLIVVVPKRAGTGPVTITINNDTINGPIFTYIYKVTVTTLAGNGIRGQLDGPDSIAEFRDPHGVSVDLQGNVYVIDGDFITTAATRIRKISTTGLVSTIAGTDSAGFLDGKGTQASFKSSLGEFVDTQGNLFIADSYGYRIRKMTPLGDVSTIAGNGIKGFADGISSIAEFSLPFNIALDATGNLFITDQFNNRIRKISPAGIVSTYAGTGINGKVDGVAANALFNNPVGLTIDSRGNLFETDDGLRVRKITPDGMVSTIAGNNSGDNNGYRDGPAADALFNYAVGIAVDTHGNLYLADSENHRIRKLTPDGIVSTLAGNGIESFADGSPEHAEFSYPTSIAVDLQGNVYVADTYNERIRKILIE